MTSPVFSLRSSMRASVIGAPLLPTTTPEMLVTCGTLYEAPDDGFAMFGLKTCEKQVTAESRADRKIVRDPRFMAQYLESYEHRELACHPSGTSYSARQPRNRSAYHLERQSNPSSWLASCRRA